MYDLVKKFILVAMLLFVVAPNFVEAGCKNGKCSRQPIRNIFRR